VSHDLVTVTVTVVISHCSLYWVQNKKRNKKTREESNSKNEGDLNNRREIEKNKSTIFNSDKYMLSGKKIK